MLVHENSSFSIVIPYSCWLGSLVAQRWIVRPFAPERPTHVWSYDLVEANTHNGRSPRLLKSGMTEYPDSTFRIQAFGAESRLAKK